MTIEDEKGSFTRFLKVVKLWDQAFAQPVGEDGCLGPTVWCGKASVHLVLGMTTFGVVCVGLRVSGMFKTWNIVPCLIVAFTWEDECRVECHPFSGYTFNDGDQLEVVAL